MRITYDEAKRRKTLEERGLDFDEADAVFSSACFEIEDRRKEYGERRIVCYGFLNGRLVAVCYTPRGADRHVFSMRKANAREKARITPPLRI